MIPTFFRTSSLHRSLITVLAALALIAACASPPPTGSGPTGGAGVDWPSGDGSTSTQPGDDAGTTPADDTGTAPADDTGTAPVEDTGTAPAEDTGTTPAEDTGTTPAEDAGTTPAEDVVEDAGTTPADDADAAPADDGGSIPQEDAGDPPVEDTGPEDIAPENCVDNDGDGYGLGCEAGDDCDDGNKFFAVWCPNCSMGTFAGCPCKSGPVPCYTGDPLYIGKGQCKAGTQQCVAGYYAACVGEVLPDSEGCDNMDNDCDGLTDEGVLSPCGNCDMSCTKQGQGPTNGVPFEPTPKNSAGIKLDANGYIVIDSTKKAQGKHHIWIANSPEASVSKLDTKTGWEVGRYYVCSNPSRTSVDLNGDVWVGCRGDGGVAKIRADIADCSDKNGNGKIDTSIDLNGDHVIQPNERMPKGQDECVVFTVFPDGATVARAAGVDKDNHAWIGFWNSKNLHRLEPKEGKSVDMINIPCSPYGLVIDQQGTIWAQGAGCALVRADPKTHDVKTYKPNGGSWSPYGINVDAFGKIWEANTGTKGAWRYDPTTGAWDFVATPGRGRGVATSADGYVYLASDSSHGVSVINAKTMQSEGLITGGGMQYPVGIALDFEGFVWAVNQSGASATKIDPKTKQIIGTYPVGPSPYTYSDMTGYTLHTFTAPTGQFKTIFGISGYSGNVAEVPEDTEWQSVDIDGVFPPKSYIKVRVRAAKDLDKLDQSPWIGPFGPIPPKGLPLIFADEGKIANGRFLEVELELHAGEDDLSPVIKSIQAKGKLVANGP